LNGTTGRKPANPEEYCKDLDVEKIGDAVAYPSNALAIGLVRELDLAVELAKAYNNWAYDFCKSTGNRVKYAAVIAPQVVPEAVKETRRAVIERGAVGVMMPTYVQWGLDLGQPEFDSIYAEAQRLGVSQAARPRTLRLDTGASLPLESLGVVVPVGGGLAKRWWLRHDFARLCRRCAGLPHQDSGCGRG